MREVWAIYFHTLSSDERPFNKFCNVAWCCSKQTERELELYMTTDIQETCHKQLLKPSGLSSRISPKLSCWTSVRATLRTLMNHWTLRYGNIHPRHTTAALAVWTFNDGASGLRENIKEMDICWADACGHSVKTRTFRWSWMFSGKSREPRKKLDESRGRGDLLLMRLKHKERVSLIWLESITMFTKF